ncbi:MAG: polysaccharide biosynthesis tyrosine autokinase [Polyangiaceae bacterium]
MLRRNPQAGSGSSAASDDAILGVLQFLRTLRKFWPMVLTCVLIGAGVSLVYTKTLPRIYEAATLVELDPSANRPIDDPKMQALMPLGGGDFFDNQEYYETEYKIITSSKVLEEAARDAGLTSDFSFFGLKGPPAKPITLTEAGAALRGHVIVEPVKNSRLVAIKVDDTDPKRAKKLADAVANAFISNNLEKAVDATTDSVAWLGGQVTTVKRDLEANENALHQFKEKNDLPSTSINDSSNMVRLEMQDYDKALTDTRTRKQELLARSAELAKVSPDSPDLVGASELLSSSYLGQLRKEYLDAVREGKGLRASGKGDNHPLVKASDGRVIEAKTALIAEIKNIQGAVDRDLAVVEREEAGEATLYEQAHKKAVDLGMKEIEYHRLDRSRDENEKLYAMLNGQMKSADLARMMHVNNLHLIESASEPGAPIRPRVPLNVMMGLVFGLLAGVGLVWLRNTLDSTLKMPDDVESYLGVTFLGLLPAMIDDPNDKGAKKAGGKLARSTKEVPVSELIVHERPHSGIAEAARGIRTNLLFTNPDKPFHKLLVTSSAPAEGKTTVACSIAIALAQSGQRTCIIDCDLRRPRLHRIFNRVGDAGLTTLLVGDATLEEVAKPTVVENLWSIPAGPIPPNPADLFHSERFKKFLARASESFDRIVIDSPPLVAVTDSAILSTLVDGTVFVIRAASTTRALAAQGMRTLADVDAPVVGAVLNGADLRRHEYSYYQYYYYKREGYGEGSDPRNASSRASGDDDSHSGTSASPPTN